MARKKFLIFIAVLVLTILFVNSVAIKLHWYYSIWWFDMLMHFLGGFWLGLLLLYGFFPNAISFKLLLKLFLGVLIVGLGWEVFEIIVKNILFKEMFYLLDTLSDLFFDLAGGSFALIYFSKKILYKLENNI